MSVSVCLREAEEKDGRVVTLWLEQLGGRKEGFSMDRALMVNGL